MLKAADVERDKLVAEFDRQARQFVEDRYEEVYASLTGRPKEDFFRQLSILGKLVRTSGELGLLQVQDGNIPCLVVIPDNLIPVQAQTHRLYAGIIDGARGEWEGGFIKKHYCRPERLPSELYLIFDVEPGLAVTGDITFATNKFNREDRRGLTGEEGVALLRSIPDLLAKRSIYLIGVAKDPRGKILAFQGDKGARLYYSIGMTKAGFGIPSARKLTIPA